jgi:23S rRNA pseudouridine955/2504/2580 synthase
VAQEIIVAARQSGKKLESYLARSFPIGYVRKLFRRHAVRLNGRRAKALDLVHAGDRIELFIPFEFTPGGATSRQRASSKIAVLFEDTDLLVLDKPSGLAVHEAKNIAKNRTLIGLLEAHFRQASFKPRLVHRLDKDTSGVLLVAKKEEVARELENRFEEGEIKKEYLCLIAGRPARHSGTIDFPLPGRDGKLVRAITHYRIEKRFLDTTLARVTIETGRMHQIRLHFAKLGYPVVMDNQHGDFTFNKSFRKRIGLKRQFVHAARLALTFRGKHSSWEAPLPDDLQRTIQVLADEQRKLGAVRGPLPLSSARHGEDEKGD